MKRIYPLFWDLIIFFSSFLPGLLIAERNIDRYRYAEWVTLDRTLLDSLLFSLPLQSILCSVVARTYLRETFPWRSRNLKRSRYLVKISSLRFALVGFLGLMAGWSPCIYWAVKTATYGHLSGLNITAVFLWYIADSLICTMLAVYFNSIWPGVGISLFWIIVFEYGRNSANDSAYSAKTHLGPLAIDGSFANPYAPLTQNPTLLYMRIIGAVAIVLMSLSIIDIESEGFESREKFKFLLIKPTTILAIIAFSLMMPESIYVNKISNQKIICSGSDPKVCIYPVHGKDRKSVEESVKEVSKSINPIKIGPVVDELGITKNTWGPNAISLSVSPSLERDQSDDFKQQIVYQVVNPYGCYSGSSAKNVDVGSEINAWLLFQSGIPKGVATQNLTPDQISKFNSLNKNPEESKKALAKVWSKIQTCQATEKDITK